jgi:hypothetical protein
MGSVLQLWNIRSYFWAAMTFTSFCVCNTVYNRVFQIGGHAWSWGRGSGMSDFPKEGDKSEV